MSFKLVKDATGKVIAYGPGPSAGPNVDVVDEEGNVIGFTQTEIDHYCPTVPEGCTLEIVENYTHVPERRDVALRQIVELETSNPITHRALRETFLAVGALIERATGMPAAANPAFAKLAAVNAQIDALATEVRTP